MALELSDKQRQALEHVERARAEGVKLSQYLRTQGIALRPVYDALAAARRKGVAASVSSALSAKRTRSRFVEVRMAPSVARGPIVCRVLIGGDR